MSNYLLDTNIITSILKKNEAIHKKLKNTLSQNANILLSPVVFYEIYRGLYHKGMKKEIKFLNELTKIFSWCDMKYSTWRIGAELWSDCRKQGRPTGEGIDKDVLIAAVAKEHNAIVVTNNAIHFEYLGISHEDW